MKDIFMMGVGILSTVLVLWFDVDRVKRGEFESSVFKMRKSKIKERVVWSISFIVIFFMKNGILQKYYALFFMVSMGVAYTMIYLMLYRLEKDNKHILSITIIDSIVIFFVIVFAKVCVW